MALSRNTAQQWKHPRPRLRIRQYRQLLDVTVQKAIEPSARSGRAGKNRCAQSDILSYVLRQKHNVILFRESVYNIPQAKMKPTLDRYARYLTEDGVFVAYVSRDSTKKVTAIVRWIEADRGQLPRRREAFAAGSCSRRLRLSRRRVCTGLSITCKR
jgi:hypothetical protein